MYNPLLADFFKNAGCVGFLGLGKSNLAVLSLLPKEIQIVLRSEFPLSKKDIPRKVRHVKFFEGAHAFDNPIEDILFISPSVRRERVELNKFKEKGVVFSSDLELFIELNKKDVFSVTGSDGKSTTATLAASLLSSDKSVTVPVGNVGTPFVKDLISKGTYTVAELSSFSLRYAAPRSKRAVVTNITPNHLNWHTSYEEYRETKISLLKYADEAIICGDDAFLLEYGKTIHPYGVASLDKSLEQLKQIISAHVYYTAEDGYFRRNGERLFAVSSLGRQESHNIKNMLSALALTDGFVTKKRAEKVASDFGGLPHRLEKFAAYNGVKFVDSSIDTSPARCAQSLCSFDDRVIVILGGRGKGTGYEELRKPISEHAKLAVITGENRKEIYDDTKGSTDIAVIEDFEEAVLYAASVAEPNDTVLLSPASVSFDSFQSFEERGNKFKKIVLNFINKQQNS